VNQVWVLEQEKLAVVGARRGENVRELTVVVVPRELEGTAAIVLLFGLRGPGIISPACLLVVARWICGSFAADLLYIVKGLLPKFTLSWLPLPSLLAPVGKQGS